MKALNYCHVNGIGDFRINSQILPLKTHPEIGYDIMELPHGHEIVKAFKACGWFSKKNNLRITFHPDQFIILSSIDPSVVRRSIADREPLFHISSPLDGWQGKEVRKHHDYIDINDFPMAWVASDLTVEVEAKAKEMAVLKLIGDLKTWR